MVLAILEIDLHDLCIYFNLKYFLAFDRRKYRKRDQRESNADAANVCGRI